MSLRESEANEAIYFYINIYKNAESIKSFKDSSNFIESSDKIN